MAHRRGFLLSLAVQTSLATACRPDQAARWNKELSFYGAKSPSWPSSCHVLYAWKNEEDFLRLEELGIYQHNLTTWNCFLGDADDMEIGDLLCVNATIDGAVVAQSNTSSSYTWPIRFWTTYPESSTTTATATVTTAPIAQAGDGSATSGLVFISIPTASTSPLPYPTPEPSAETIVTMAHGIQATIGLRPALPSASVGAIQVNFTASCDAESGQAEDCRVSIACDASLRQYATCINGQCECQAIPCTQDTECEIYKQCREDEENYTCIPEPYMYPSVSGVCGCVPRDTGCLFEEEPHRFCQGKIECTGIYFSIYPEFPQCMTSDDWFTHPRGRCACESITCKLSGDVEADGQACSELMQCSGADKPQCALKYGNDSRGADDGYCTCGN